MIEEVGANAPNDESPEAATPRPSTDQTDTQDVAPPPAPVNGNLEAGRPWLGPEYHVERRAARYYLSGLAVTPTKGKKPLLPDWQKSRSLHDEIKHLRDDMMPGFLPHPFPSGINVGVLNGEPSGGLLDVDLDASEAVTLA